MPFPGSSGLAPMRAFPEVLAWRNAIHEWTEPPYNGAMATQLTIDKAGRIVIPKSLRDQLHLEPGDSLELEHAGEEITLRTVRGTGTLTREHGVWVFHAGDPISASITDGLLRQIREDRDLHNRGEDE
jgi:AbrB family looped-hinge helix DNA binding protein